MMRTCHAHAGDVKQCYYASLRPGDLDYLPVSDGKRDITPEELEAEHPRNAALVAAMEEGR